MPSSMKPAITRKAQLTPLGFLVHMPDLPGSIRELQFSPPLSDAELETSCKRNEALASSEHWKEPLR